MFGELLEFERKLSSRKRSVRLGVEQLEAREVPAYVISAGAAGAVAHVANHSDWQKVLTFRDSTGANNPGTVFSFTVSGNRAGASAFRLMRSAPNTTLVNIAVPVSVANNANGTMTVTLTTPFQQPGTTHVNWQLDADLAGNGQPVDLTLQSLTVQSGTVNNMVVNSWSKWIVDPSTPPPPPPPPSGTYTLAPGMPGSIQHRGAVSGWQTIQAFTLYTGANSPGTVYSVTVSGTYGATDFQIYRSQPNTAVVNVFMATTKTVNANGTITLTFNTPYGQPVRSSTKWEVRANITGPSNMHLAGVTVSTPPPDRMNLSWDTKWTARL